MNHHDCSHSIAGRERERERERTHQLFQHFLISFWAGFLHLNKRARFPKQRPYLLSSSEPPFPIYPDHQLRNCSPSPGFRTQKKKGKKTRPSSMVNDGCAFAFQDQVCLLFPINPPPPFSSIIDQRPCIAISLDFSPDQPGPSSPSPNLVRKKAVQDAEKKKKDLLGQTLIPFLMPLHLHPPQARCFSSEPLKRKGRKKIHKQRNHKQGTAINPKAPLFIAHCPSSHPSSSIHPLLE